MLPLAKFSFRNSVGRNLRQALPVALLAAVLAPASFAASFTVNAAPPPDTTATILGSGSGQTGTVNSGGILSVSGSSVAVTISGNNETLTNNGTILQTGTGRAIRDNTGVTGLVVNNHAGALLQTADADVIQMNKATGGVTLNNSGSMISLNASAGGAQAVDFSAVTSSPNIVNNFAGGLLKAFEADAVRPGVNGMVNNSGTILSITTAGNSSDGVDAQGDSGVQVVNSSGGLIEGGRHGITGGAADNVVTFTTSVANDAGATIRGDNGSGINLDGFNANQTATIVNHGTIIGNGHDIGDGAGHDGDGIDVDGVVNITNTGTIKSLNSFGVGGGLEYSEGATVGGGTITNSGTIEGSVAAGNTTAIGRGITIAGVDKDVNGFAIPVQAPYAATTITNSGLIKGDSDSGIIFSSALASGFTHTIDNQAGGVIQTASTTAAAILTAPDKTIINNSGTIDGASSGKAITGGAGYLTVNILGGSASVLGDLTGGAGTNVLNFNLGAPANTFTAAGAISNFSQVEAVSGQTTLSGANIYTGTTTVDGGATLRVTGTHTGGGAYEVKSGGTLGGSGTLDLASASTAILIAQGGDLHIDGGRLTLASASMMVNGTMTFDLNGLAAGVAGGYDQLLFSAGHLGTVTLGSDSILAFNLGFSPVIGSEFTLIDLANSATAVSGTFSGLREGAVFNEGGTQFKITYHGGDGNDVVVRAVPDSAATAALLGLALAGVFALPRSRRARRA